MGPNKIRRSSYRKSRYVPDPSRRTHFLHARDLGSTKRQFEAFQSWLATSGLHALRPASLTLACLIAFDGIATDADLCAAYAACHDAARLETALRVDWKSGSRLDARHLSAWTALALTRVTEWEPFDVAQAQLVQALNEGCVMKNSGAMWDDLLAAAMGWLQIHLPPVLFGHVGAAAPLTALPRSALARAQTRLALQPELDESVSANPSSDPVYSRAFEAALLGRPASARSGAAFLQQLLAALRPPAKGSNASKREEILHRLNSLAASLDEVDEACAVLYIFALDLVENGTRRKKTLAPTTPSDYLNAFAIDFHIALDGVRLYGIDEATYSGAFRKLVSNDTVKSSARVAALKAFHQFLRAWWRVPNLPAYVLQIVVETKVRANLVWPHEKERLRQWLGEHVSDHRFVAQLGTALEIASDAPVRIGELLVLRIANLIDEECHLIVEIARELRDGKEKSREGRRRVVIRDKTAMATVRAWLARRHAELATSEDYLFGEASRPMELAHAGRMYFWLNRLLKAATGDDSISLHALRHSHASQHLAVMLQQNNDDEVNPLDSLANEVGHAGGHVTVVNYCHLYEAGLRRAIDLGLQRLALDYAGTSTWTGVSPDTLRQRASRAARRGNPGRQELWKTLVKTAERMTFPPISKSIAMATPTSPLPFNQPRSLTYDQVVGVLHEVSNGLSIRQVALRHGVTESEAGRMVEAVGSFAERHGRTPLLMSDLLSVGVEALQDPSGRLLGMRADFGRLSQLRWRQLTRAITKFDALRLQRATSYWDRAVTGRHLAVRPGSEWDSFIQLIADCDINRNLMALYWSATDQGLHQVSEALARAQATVRHRLGSTLPQVRHTHRHGRPPVWLVIGSKSALLNTDGSANSAAGLHCAFLAAHVWIGIAHTERSDLK